MKKNLTDTLLDLDSLAGQKMMTGFDGLLFNSDLEFLISELKVCGLILFSRNIESPEQLKALVNQIISFTKQCKLPKLFIAIDQEGGQVARLKKPFTVYKGNPYIYNKNDAENFAQTQAKELNELNINMNFAPVLDVIPDNFESIMEKRAFKGDAQKVGELGSHVIKTMQKVNTMAVAKHFPGIGRTSIDSHFELPIVDRNITELFSEELIPFKKAIKSNVSGIMLSHILYPNIDSKWQASLSPQIAKNLLREKLGYNGLIMTDDLDMKSVKHDIKTSAKQILLSEIDIVLICHNGPDIENMFNELKSLIKHNRKFSEAAKKSFERIIEIKNQYLQ
ncbi:MAG: beta-N-acetylhexosaminidase [Desulfobacteraceae bacterium]|nr:beta-N-acetylhexosaminidase [Desulfobacteraceae bacterium]